MFRYDRPQKGRFRQFNQAGVEIIGDGDSLSDSIAILLLWQIFTDLGLSEDIVVEINSIGCKTCRTKYKKKLLDYYQSYKNFLCADCLKRMEANPLRLLDCKEEKCQKIAATAPQLIDFLCIDCKNHFMKTLEYLDDLSIPYDLNPRLVRGLDYYTRTAFEVRYKNDLGRQASLGGGGRYDNLIELMGGRPTPAIGWAIGYERIIEKLKEKNVSIAEKGNTDLFIIQIGEKARKKALNLLSELSKKNYNASCVLGKESLKSQLKAANGMNAKVVIIIGQREALDNTVIVKNMDDASQETINLNKLEKYLEKRFRK
jgi:histidyl-tRNA synthetase